MTRGRICVDYRGPNNKTRKDSGSLPLRWEPFDRLRSTTAFTEIDLRDTYHHISIGKKTSGRVPSRTRYGHFEYLVVFADLADCPYRRLSNRIWHDQHAGRSYELAMSSASLCGLE